MVNSIVSYADYLKQRGETVVELGGVSWMHYNHALIPTAAMPVNIIPNQAEALEAIKQTGALFLRYTCPSQAGETSWWYMVCRQYGIEHVSANTRSKIRRGLKRMAVTRVEPHWLAEHGHSAHVHSYQRYKQATPMDREVFRQFILSLQDQSIFDVWVCQNAEEILGYIICLHESDGVFMHTVDITPTGLHNYAAYAAIHTVLEYYINTVGIPVTNGSRSIAHQTDMQDFLLKFNFFKEFSELHVIYRPDVELVVRMLYPLRNLIKHLEIFPIVHKISAVLFQEAIQRRQQVTKHESLAAIR